MSAEAVDLMQILVDVSPGRDLHLLQLDLDRPKEVSLVGVQRVEGSVLPDRSHRAHKRMHRPMG